MQTLITLLFGKTSTTDRDSKGRFIAGNSYRIRRRAIVIAGEEFTVLMQDVNKGKFFKAL